MRIIIYNPTTQLFTFFIESLVIELQKLLVDTLVINNISIEESLINYEKDIILILINPHFIYDYQDISDEINKISNKFKLKILYITEPVNFIIEKKVYLELINKIKPYCLWTYTFANFNKINSHLKIFKIFPEYNEAYNFTNLERIKYKNIKNIIFFGNINENRINICSEFRNELINKTDLWTKEEWADILNNYLFYLNIHRRTNCKSFESFRIIPILANGGVIFSERTNTIDEDIYFKYNIVFFDKNHLYNAFKLYIENINYENIINKAHRFRDDIRYNNELKNYLDFHNNK
jgi:hypothetical protein